MDIAELIHRNRKPRQQKGEIIETDTAFLGRYYYTAEDGTRKQKAVMLAQKSDLYRSKTTFDRSWMASWPVSILQP